MKKSSRILTIFIAAAMLVSMTAISMAAQITKPAEDMLPVVSSPAAGILVINEVGDETAVRISKNGTPFSEWMMTEDESIVVQPLGGGEYSVEVCHFDAIEEGYVVKAENIAVAPWADGSLKGKIAEPETKSNNIDMSKAQFCEELEENTVYLAGDEYASRHNMNVIYGVSYGAEGVTWDDMLPYVCNYYTYNEKTENGSLVWYRLDSEKEIVLTAKEDTKAGLERWNMIDSVKLVSDNIRADVGIDLASTDFELKLIGDNELRWIYGGNKLPMVIYGSGTEKLTVEHGILSSAYSLTVKDLGALDLNAEENSALYCTADESFILVENIKGDVNINSNCYADSAVIAYGCDVIFESIDGNLNITAEGGNGIYSDRNIKINNIAGDVIVTSAENCAVCAEGDVSITNVNSIKAETKGEEGTGFCEFGPYAVHANGDITLEKMDSAQFISSGYVVSALGIYTEDEVREYVSGGNIKITDVGLFKAEGECVVSAEKDITVTGVNAMEVNASAIGIFAYDNIVMEDVTKLDIVAEGDEAYAMAGQVKTQLDNVKQVTIKADNFGIAGRDIVINNTNVKIEAGRRAFNSDMSVNITADGNLTVKAGKDEASAVEIVLEDGVFPADNAEKFVTVQAELPGYLTCEGNRSCPMWEYADLAGNTWYHDGIHYCIENGLMSGYGDGSFGPADGTTRGMIVTILHRIAGKPASEGENIFTDVSDKDYFCDAVIWANESGIAGGYGNGKFGANDAITREQLTAMLWRFAKYMKMDVSVGEDTNILSYDDVSEVSDYAVEAVQWACGDGIISGKPTENNSFRLDPKGGASRAEAAVMLMRFAEKLN